MEIRCDFQHHSHLATSSAMVSLCQGKKTQERRNKKKTTLHEDIKQFLDQEGRVVLSFSLVIVTNKQCGGGMVTSTKA